MSPDSITLTRPDDWHLHLRDGAALATSVPHTARCFARAIVMPNLKPPVTTVAAAEAYRQRILAALPASSDFEPLMTLYLTDTLAPAEIDKASESGFVKAVKYYPAGATTNSDSGVTAIENVYPVLEQLQRHGMPLLIHGEVTDSDVDIFDREAVFIDRVLQPLRERMPELKIVLEHITTRQAVQFIDSGDDRLAATITIHHLLYNRNHLLAGGVRPHFYCLPILKRDVHQQALVEAATSGKASFFLGTDSAPHPRQAKESDCGCAGIYTAPAALELYAELFERENALQFLEGFASHHGPDFYGLQRNQDSITLERKPWKMAASFDFGDDQVVPVRAGEEIGWRLQESAA